MELHPQATAIMSDEQIVELYFARDEQAIKETDIKYKNFLLSVAYNIVHDTCDSEECLNDTYISAWNLMPPTRPTFLKAFLTTIMRRAAIDCYKANKRKKRIASELTVSLSELEDLISDDDDMYSEAEAKMKDMFNTEATQYISHSSSFDPRITVYDDQIYVQYYVSAKFTSSVHEELSSFINIILIPMDMISN